MGRIGIGYVEVAEAALALQAEGKAVTVDAIRNRIGTGSKTTINQHLKQWKSEQDKIGNSQFPKELQLVVSGLWERLQAESALKIEAMIQRHKSECENLQSMLVEATQSREATLQSAQNLETQLNIAITQNEHLESEALQLKQALLQLEERCTTTQAQLTDSKSENERLHRLASQIQNNLAHYQQAIEQLRIEQALENEKQSHQFQSQLLALTNQYQETKIELMRTTQALTQLDDQHKNKVIEVVELKTISEELAHKNSVLQERLSQLQKTLEIETIAKEANHAHIQSLAQQNAILGDQNARLERTLQINLDKLSHLEHERNQLQTEIAIMQAMRNSTIGVS